MEEGAVPGFPSRPNLRLQATSFTGFAAPSLSPSFKLDEGYSDDTRSQSDKDIVSDNAMMLPEWILAQSEADRAGKSPSPRPALHFAKLAQPPLLSPPANAPSNFRTRV
jgi:F-box and WD-40 domain protein 1/11